MKPTGELRYDAIYNRQLLIRQARESNFPSGSHEVERLREKAREIFQDIENVDRETYEISILLERDERHLNDLLGLRYKIKRDTSARAVLSGVDFTNCPRCTQPLPKRQEGQCIVCGQTEHKEISDEEEAQVEADIKIRIADLEDAIKNHRENLSYLEGDRRRANQEKNFIDSQINEALARYDSQYLSSNLDLERQLASLEREYIDIQRLQRLQEVIERNEESVRILTSDEKGIRAELKEARAETQKDTGNLELLRDLFLDCLVRSKLAGFNEDDIVKFEAPDFMPKVSTHGEQDIILTTFDNISSGGKKTLFKCCFAIALHRLASIKGSPLPKILIIDSPMKNISERENREQFEGFHDMLYELASSELRNTQFVFIDKEYKEPSGNFDVKELYVRHMTPDQDDNPPLISYYRGK